MQTHYANFPPFKSDIKKAFGHLYFHHALLNLDVVGVKILKSEEFVVVIYRAAKKVGHIYEGEFFSEDDVNKIYSDVPDNYNDLEAYEKSMSENVEIWLPDKKKYVMITEDRAIEAKFKN